MRISKRGHIAKKEKIVSIGCTWVATDGIVSRERCKYMASIWDRAHGCGGGNDSAAQYLNVYNGNIVNLIAEYSMHNKSFLRIYYCWSPRRRLLIYFVLYTPTVIDKSPDSLAIAKNVFQRQSLSSCVEALYSMWVTSTCKSILPIVTKYFCMLSELRD